MHADEQNNSAGASQPVVLIVEDNPAMRALIRSLVEEVTPLVHECVTGEHAIERFEQLRPDWVLMDVELGGMDGIAATRVICDLHPDARVIIVTNHGEPEFREAARSAGATDFVHKESLLALPAMLLERPDSLEPAGV